VSDKLKTEKGIEIDVCEARAGDVPLLLELIRKMAAFERLEVSATEASLGEALFGEAPAAKALLVRLDGETVGYVTYFFTFGSMAGRRGLWLDDIYVEERFRGRGIGRAIMVHLADIAVSSGCARFEWMVLDWNEAAIGFYRKLGAKLLHDLRICRLDGERLAKAAG
jgi:GNAT superfamily N-acetyltransferase